MTVREQDFDTNSALRDVHSSVHSGKLKSVKDAPDNFSFFKKQCFSTV